MTEPKLRRESRPDNPHAPFDGTVYGVYVDGRRVGQVWQVGGVTWGSEKALGRTRHARRTVVDWTWTGSRGQLVSTRSEAVGELL